MAVIHYLRYDITRMRNARFKYLKNPARKELHFGVIWPMKQKIKMTYIEGVKFAIEKINKDKSQHFRLIPHYVDEENIDSLAWNFIRDKRIGAVLGTLNSGNVKKSAPLFDNGGILYLQSGTSPFVMFRRLKLVLSVSSSDMIHSFNLEKIISSLKLKRPAVIYGSTEYCDKLENLLFFQVAEDKGVHFVAKVIYDPSIDWGYLYEKINTRKFDGIIFLGYGKDGHNFLHFIRSSSCNVPFIGNEEIDRPVFWQGLPESDLKQVYCSSYYVNFDRTPELQLFYREYKQKFDHDPDAYSVFGYAATMLLAKASSQVKSLSPQLLRNAIMYQEFKILGLKFVYTETGILKLDLTACKQWAPGKGFMVDNGIKKSDKKNEARKYFQQQQ